MKLSIHGMKTGLSRSSSSRLVTCETLAEEWSTTRGSRRLEDVSSLFWIQKLVKVNLSHGLSAILVQSNPCIESLSLAVEEGRLTSHWRRDSVKDRDLGILR